MAVLRHHINPPFIRTRDEVAIISYPARGIKLTTPPHNGRIPRGSSLLERVFSRLSFSFGGLMSKIVGIDLGTTNSVVAIMEGKEVKVIPNKHGSNLTPSVVGFTESGERLLGQLARRQSIVNPRNTVYSIKRFMGRRRSEVSQEEKMFPYEVVGA